MAGAGLRTRATTTTRVTQRTRTRPIPLPSPTSPTSRTRTGPRTAQIQTDTDAHSPAPAPLCLHPQRITAPDGGPMSILTVADARTNDGCKFLEMMEPLAEDGRRLGQQRRLARLEGGG